MMPETFKNQLTPWSNYENNKLVLTAVAECEEAEVCEWHKENKDRSKWAEKKKPETFYEENKTAHAATDFTSRLVIQRC